MFGVLKMFMQTKDVPGIWLQLAKYPAIFTIRFQICHHILQPHILLSA